MGIDDAQEPETGTAEILAVFSLSVWIASVGPPLAPPVYGENIGLL